MRLVNEIIDLLSSSTPNLENALFKAQVLAHKLGEGNLKSWVDSELKGYAKSSELPSYRVLNVTVMGSFSDGVRRYSEQPLPIMHIDEQLRRKLQVRQLFESVVVIDKWSKSESDLSIVIAPEFYHELSKGLGGGYTVDQAWGKNSVGAMLQVVVEVRSRLLELALQIADRIPREPELADIKQISKDIDVGGIFRNAVFGDNATIVVGGGSIQGVNNSVTRNDFNSLANALKSHCVPDEDIAALEHAINEDKGSEDHERKSFGPKVRHWIGDMISKAGSATWHVSIGAAGNILGSALGAFYGFGG